MRIIFHFPFSSFIVPNIRLIFLVSNTLSLHSFLNIRYHVNENDFDYKVCFQIKLSNCISVLIIIEFKYLQFEGYAINRIGYKHNVLEQSAVHETKGCGPKKSSLLV
jgi:hypothetical protein